MNIRSIYELEDYLDKDLAWRKKEFTTIKFMIRTSRKHEIQILKKNCNYITLFTLGRIFEEFFSSLFMLSKSFSSTIL